MYRRLSSIAVALALLTVTAGVADAACYMLHIQGRGWSSWSAELPSVSGCANVTLNFNGNAKLNGNETNVTVRNAILNHCSSGNTCILHAYSAGALRVLKAVSDLRAMGHPLAGLLYSEFTASAAGGCGAACISTKGFVGFIAKLFGQQEKIDFDLCTSTARNTWGHVQDDMGSTVYHLAGNKDIKKKILFWKISGNKYAGPGSGDGLVSFHSSAGASAVAAYTNACTAPKYPYRAYEYADGASCYGENRDHFGMPGRTAKLLGNLYGSGYVDYNRSWGDVATNPDCDDASGACDNAFESAGQDFSKTPGLAYVAGDVSAYSSNTTGNTASSESCFGKCGGWADRCYCDAACSSLGDCCGDYDAANCPIVNQ